MKISTFQMPVRLQRPEGKPVAIVAGNSLTPAPSESVRLEATARTSEEPKPEIPDVRGMLARKPRFSELNFEINKAYVKMAPLFQDIYDPGRELSPSWYGFAPYASRQAGSSIKMAERLTAFLENHTVMPAHQPAWEAQLEQEFPDHEEREMASFSLSLMGPAPSGEGPAPEGIGDVAHLAVAADRMRSLVMRQDGPLDERLTRISRTVRNMLEAGNLAIVSEIGVAGQDYLNFRQGREPSPQEVLQEFTVAGTPANPTQASEMYRSMEEVVTSSGPLKTDWNKEFPADRYDRSNMLVAAFAAYEAARLETDKGLKNRWIEQAGILMAFREQHDTVQPAFQSTGSSEEVSREDLIKAVTPWVEVPTQDFTWSFRDYAGQHLPRNDRNPFTPRAAEYSWGDFPTRWGGILDFFEQVNRAPGSIWPMPSPDPAVPL